MLFLSDVPTLCAALNTKRGALELHSSSKCVEIHSLTQTDRSVCPCTCEMGHRKELKGICSIRFHSSPELHGMAFNRIGVDRVRVRTTKSECAHSSLSRTHQRALVGSGCSLSRRNRVRLGVRRNTEPLIPEGMVPERILFLACALASVRRLFVARTVGRRDEYVSMCVQCHNFLLYPNKRQTWLLNDTKLGPTGSAPDLVGGWRNQIRSPSESVRLLSRREKEREKSYLV